MAWLDELQPASFRGVGFRWRDQGIEGGRRVAVFEFPVRDDAYTEDLGRSVRRYSVTGYVIGPDYLADAARLAKALDEDDAAGTLVHPYLGQITVRCQSYRRRETQDEGGMAVFEMSFVEAGSKPAPVATADTASGLLAGAESLLGSLSAAFATAYGVAKLPNFIAAAASALLSSFGNDFALLLATPGVDTSALASRVATLQAPSGIVALPGSVSDTVIGLLTGFADAAASAVVDADLPVPRDPSFGLEGFAGWGEDLAPVAETTPDRVIQGQNQAAVVQLVQVGALAAAAQLYSADGIFASANDALAAQGRMVDLIETQTLRASENGQDELVQSLQRLSAQVTLDLRQRAAQLPQVVAYSFPAPLPALVLAWRLYQDAGRADELIARNHAVHPGFLPAQGEALAS